MHREQITSPGARGARLLARPLASMLTVVVLGGGIAGWATTSALADRPGHLTAGARAARSLSVRETLQATNVSHQGNSVIHDRGRGTGTFTCAATIQVHVSYTRGAANFGCATSVGNVVATGSATFFTAGRMATFTGTVSLSGGTGRYAHARGSLHIEGTLNRKTFVMEVSVSGVMSY